MKNWIKKNRKDIELWTILIAMITLLLTTSSCSSIKVLPINTPIEDDSIDMEEFQPHYEYCKEFEYDAETWMDCMMNEQIRRNNIIRRLA